jgi:hypothetical protein
MAFGLLASTPAFAQPLDGAYMDEGPVGYGIDSTDKSGRPLWTPPAYMPYGGPAYAPHAYYSPYGYRAGGRVVRGYAYRTSPYDGYVSPGQLNPHQPGGIGRRNSAGRGYGPYGGQPVYVPVEPY